MSFKSCDIRTAPNDEASETDFDAFCDDIMKSILTSFDLEPGTEIIITKGSAVGKSEYVNVGTSGHCDYGKSHIQQIYETNESMDKRKILVICAGMGLVDTGFQDMLAELKTYEAAPEPLALNLTATDRRYWALPRNKPLPKPDNRPYYRRYERKQYR